MPTRDVSFPEHMTLLNQFVDRRPEIVDRLEHFLNAKGKEYLKTKDRAYFAHRLNAVFFDLPGLPNSLSQLRGQLKAKRLADGFQPITVTNISNGQIDPVEFVARGFDHWEHTVWPGRNVRLAYAQIVYSMFMLRQLEDVSLLMLEQEAEQTGDRLREMQSLLDRVNGTAIPNVPVFVRDARWLILTAQSPATQHVGPYFRIAHQLSRSFTKTDRLEIHKAGAKMAGGHLRSQLRYRTHERGVSIDDVGMLAETRTSNSMDNALLVYDLVPVLESYDVACVEHDSAKRLELADAILQGISAAPDLFLTGLDLLTPLTIIEDLFVEHGQDGRARYTSMGEAHMERLRRYEELIGRVAASLEEDAPRFEPSGRGYSPYGVSFGFSSDIIGNMTLRALIAKSPFEFSLEDAFVGRDDAHAKTAWTQTWKNKRRPSGEHAILEYSDEFAAQIFERLMQALHARAAQGHDPQASQRRTGRLFVVPRSVAIESLPDDFVPRGAVAAQEFVYGMSGAYPVKDMSDDRREGRCLVCHESDGEWYGISKSILTYVMGQGNDALITSIPPEAIDTLRLTCPGVIVLSR